MVLAAKAGAFAAASDSCIVRQMFRALLFPICGSPKVALLCANREVLYQIWGQLSSVFLRFLGLLYEEVFLGVGVEVDGDAFGELFAREGLFGVCGEVEEFVAFLGLCGEPFGELVYSGPVKRQLHNGLVARGVED